MKHPGTCPCPKCIKKRDAIRLRSIGAGQRIGWNAHSLDGPVEQNPLGFTGTKLRYDPEHDETRSK